MSWPSVSICVELVNEAACSGGTVYAVPPFEVSADAWVKYDATQVVGCSGSNTFKPAAQLLATDFLQSVDLSTASCSDVPGSAYTFGVGGLTPPFDLSQLDTTQITYAFSSGFLLVGMFWALGKAVGMLMGMVRR